jgi:hypothetical protein
MEITWLGYNHYLHDEEPAKEAPMASSISRWCVFTSKLGPPLKSQRPDLLILAFLFKVVAAKPQAVVAVFTLAFCILVPSHDLVLFFVTVFLVVVLIVLVLTTVFLVALEACSLLIAHKLDNGSLIHTVLIVVERESSAIKNDSYPLAPCIGVGFGVSQEFEFGVNVAVVVRCVSSSNVYGRYSRVSVYGKIDSFPNVAYYRFSLVNSPACHQWTRTLYEKFSQFPITSILHNSSPKVEYIPLAPW